MRYCGTIERRLKPAGIRVQSLHPDDRRFSVGLVIMQGLCHTHRAQMIRGSLVYEGGRDGTHGVRLTFRPVGRRISAVPSTSTRVIFEHRTCDLEVNPPLPGHENHPALYEPILFTPKTHEPGLIACTLENVPPAPIKTSSGDSERRIPTL